MPSPTTERSVVEVLRAAKERISDSERWAQGEYAYHGSHEDDYTAPDSPNACRWCAAGAVLAEYGLGREAREDEGGLERTAALKVLARAVSGQHFETAVAAVQCIADFNDAGDHSHAEVLALFDRAIELAEAGQS